MTFCQLLKVFRKNLSLDKVVHLRLMGKDDPNELAHHFIAATQGGCLLANSMKNPYMLHLHLKRLKEARVKREGSI
jgi:hypothetical protein